MIYCLFYSSDNLTQRGLRSDYRLGSIAATTTSDLCCRKRQHERAASRWIICASTASDRRVSSAAFPPFLSPYYTDLARLDHVTGAWVCKRFGDDVERSFWFARASRWWGKRDAPDEVARETILFVRAILSTKTNDANVAKFPSEYVRSRSWLSS